MMALNSDFGEGPRESDWASGSHVFRSCPLYGQSEGQLRAPIRRHHSHEHPVLVDPAAGGLALAYTFDLEAGLFMGPHGGNITGAGGRRKAPEDKVRKGVASGQPNSFGGDSLFPVVFVPNPDQDIGNPMPGTDWADLDVSDVVAPVVRDDGEQYQGSTGTLREFALKVLGDLHILPPIEVRLADIYEGQRSQMDCGTLNAHFKISHLPNVHRSKGVRQCANTRDPSCLLLHGGWGWQTMGMGNPYVPTTGR